MESKTVRLQGSLIIVPENPVSRFLFADTRSAWIWLSIRVYVGCAWRKAGIGKVTSPAWTGEKGGAAIKGFVSGAMLKPEEGKDVTGRYAWFLENTVLPNAKI